MGECGWVKLQCEVYGGGSSPGGSGSKTSEPQSVPSSNASAIAVSIGGVATTATSTAGSGAGAWLFRLFGAAGLALYSPALGDGSLPMGAPNMLKSDSRELGANLVAVGAPRYDGDHAHHIVASGDTPRAAPAWLIIAAAGMNINDPHNGIFLRGPAHQVIHTDKYYAAVNIGLFGAVGYRGVQCASLVCPWQFRQGHFQNE